MSEQLQYAQPSCQAFLITHFSSPTFGTHNTPTFRPFNSGQGIQGHLRIAQEVSYQPKQYQRSNHRIVLRTTSKSLHLSHFDSQAYSLHSQAILSQPYYSTQDHNIRIPGPSVSFFTRSFVSQGMNWIEHGGSIHLHGYNQDDHAEQNKYGDNKDLPVQTYVEGKIIKP